MLFYEGDQYADGRAAFRHVDGTKDAAYASGGGDAGFV